PDIFLVIDEAGYGYVWAHTTNEQAGGIQKEPWTTTENHLDVYGSGHSEYHEDGHFSITINPEVLPTEKIPEFVDDFRWNEPELIKGENVKLRLDSDNRTISVEPEIPPIEPLNRWITLYPEAIRKYDGIVPMKDL